MKVKNDFPYPKEDNVQLLKDFYTNKTFYNIIIPLQHKLTF